MNKIILSVLIFLFSVNGFAQDGVKFMEGSFQEALNVAKQQKKMVFVDVYTSWCGPCKMLAPVLEETAQELQGKVEIVKVDVDQDASLAAQFRIMSVPTMILFRNGEAIQKISGFQPKPQLVSFLKQFI